MPGERAAKRSEEMKEELEAKYQWLLKREEKRESTHHYGLFVCVLVVVAMRPERKRKVHVGWETNLGQ